MSPVKRVRLWWVYREARKLHDIALRLHLAYPSRETRLAELEARCVLLQARAALHDEWDVVREMRSQLEFLRGLAVKGPVMTPAYAKLVENARFN